MIRKLMPLFCVLYFSFIFYAVFLARRRGGPALPEAERIVFVPGRNVLQFFTENAHTSKDYYSFYSNLLGNVIMFIPFPFFLDWVFGVKDYRTGLFIAVSTSILIEGIQYILHIGVADINDVALNTLGAIVGLVITSNSIFKKKLAGDK